MSEAELLARDKFAANLDARLLESGDRVVVEMSVQPHHFDADGRVASAVMFSLADCAMSLISNSDRTAVAIAAHLVVSGPIAAERLSAIAVGRLDDGARARTWDIEVQADGVRVALFAGTTWTIGS